MKRVVALIAALLVVPLLVRLVVAQAPPPSQAPPPPTYTLTDLGPMTVGAIDSQNVKAGPTALNGNAQVIGFRANSSFNSQFIGFLWDKGMFTDLGTGGGPSSFAYGINNAGQIVGTSNFPGDLTGNSARAFIWQNGMMTNLNPDPNFWSRAYAINTGGDVAGFINNGPYLPVIWKGGTAAGKTMLPSLPCSLVNCQGEALAINDSGQVAGWSVGGSVNVARPVMWDSNGQPTDLIPSPGYYTEANGINNGGVVVGYYQPQQLSNTPMHAFSWQSGTLTDLGAVGNDTNSGAWGINTKGDIVGISATTANAILFGPGTGGRAFLYTGGIMYDLSSLLAPGTNWSLDTAFVINDKSQIVGTGIAPDRTEHGYLLTPIITPTTTTLTASVSSLVFGQQVSFVATVSPTASSSLTPTGNVTFSDGSTLGSGTASGNGVWIFNTSALSVGSHSITASYSGDPNFAASTSAALTQTVGQDGTTTTLAASASTVSVGQAVTLTATVTAAAPGAGAPTGMITFSGNGMTLTCSGGNQTLSAGQATCQYGFGTAGAQSLTASYGGDTNFTGSMTSSAVMVTVQSPPPPTVQVTDNETIHVTDTSSFPDVFDTEAVRVSDAVFVTPLINVGAPVAEYSAGGLGFGNVAAGQTSTQSLTLSDIGQAPLVLSSAAISQSSAFSISQMTCSNGATSLPTSLPVGGGCTFVISYTSPASGTGNATLTFMDNAALSNLTGTAAGASFTQSIPLNGAGSSTPPPPPPPAVIPVMDMETIQVTDSESFPDVFDAETLHVTDAVFVTPLINVAAPVAFYSAGSLGFANVAAGQTGAQSLTLSDIGQAPLTVSSAVTSQGSAFTIVQVACSNGATSLPTTLPVGGACTLVISYLAPSGTASSDTLTFTDNAALSNIASAQMGSSYTQSISLNGSGTSTPPPPPPPAVIPLVDNEAIHVTDTPSFPDVFDSEMITVSDQVTIKIISSPTTTSISAVGVPYGTAATATVSVSSPSGTVAGTVTLSVGGGAASSMALSGASATFNLGVLSAGNHSLVANFAAQGAFDTSSATGTLTVTQAPLTVTAANAQRLYGQANPTTFMGTIAGIQNGDNITATYNTAATPASPVGTYAIVPSLADPTNKLGNYTVTSNNGTLTVGPAALTVTAANAQRLYGQANPTTFMGTIAGIQNGDNITATYNTAATQASPVGAYPIVPTVVDPTNKLGNYTVTSNNGTLTVNPALLTITANNAAKTLNAPLPMLSASYSGFVNGDTAASLGGTLNCKTTATAASPVGSYPITCSGQTSTNYAIAYLPGTLAISYAAMGTMCDGAGNHVILPPINADGSSVFKQGRTVPAQFRVCDANGVSIGTPGVVSSFYLTGMVSGTTTMTVENVVDTNNPDTYFRWDPTSRQWIFNITTSNLTAGNTYVYTIALNDGSAIMFQYGLR